MKPSEKLITDRTPLDIAEMTAKGYYNVQDVARIISYIKYIAEEIGVENLMSYPTLSLGDFLTFEKMQAIINDVDILRQNWYVADDTPTTPLLVAWNYNKANDIEKILQALTDFVKSFQTDKLYAGTFRAGAQIKFRG